MSNPNGYLGRGMGEDTKTKSPMIFYPRLETYLIPGETLIPGGKGVLVSKRRKFYILVWHISKIVQVIDDKVEWCFGTPSPSLPPTG